jgi:hypothetical protein
MIPQYKKGLGIVAGVIAVLAVFFLYSGKNRDGIQNTISSHFSSKSLSAWLWESPDTFSEERLRKMFQIAEGEGITTIFLRMDDYADIYEMKDGSEKTNKIENLDGAARKFITLAKDYNIDVQALGGNTNWAEPDQLFYPDLFFEGVIRYNESSPVNARFTGIQFDVESNNSALYKKNKAEALTKYLKFVERMIDKKRSSSATSNNFSIGFATPFWYDNQNNNGVIVNWNNNLKPVGYHLFDILNGIENSYIVIMDYRNYADGVDGSIENAKNEIVYASQNAPKVKILIGQETTKVSPAKITFNDTSKKYFKGEAAKIVSAFSNYPVFGGISIHDLPSYIDL